MDKENLNGIPEEENEAVAAEQEEAAAEESVDTEQEETVEAVPENDETEEASADEEAAEENEAADQEQNEEELDEEIPEEIGEDELCPICESRRKQEDCNYCEECEKAMLKRKIPLTAWLSGLAALGFSFFAFVLVLLISAPSLQVAKGDVYAKNNCWYPAYNEYAAVSSVTEEINSYLGSPSPFVQTGMGVNKRIIESISKRSTPIDAYRAATEGGLLGSADVTKIPFMKEYSAIVDEHNAVYDAIEPALEAMFEEDAVAQNAYDAINKVRSEQLNDVFVDYYLFATANYFAEEPSKQIEFLEALDASAKASGKDYSWLYYMPFAQVLYDAGEYERAVEYLDATIENDASNYDAYELKMNIALESGNTEEASKILAQFKSDNDGFDTAYMLEIQYLRCTGETEKAEALCVEAQEAYASMPEFFRQQALICLLNGEYKEAYDAAYTADNNAYYLAYMGDSSFYNDPKLINTVYMAAYMLKESGAELTADESEMVETILESFTDADLSDITLSVIREEKTLQEVLTEGACDLA